MVSAWNRGPSVRCRWMLTAVAAGLVGLLVAAAAPALAAKSQWGNALSAKAPRGALDAALARSMRETSTPGAQAVVLDRGRLVWSANEGVARIAAAGVHPRRVTPATYFCFASFGKQILASYTLSLVEDGVLALDAPISRYVGDSIPGADDVTLRMLLSHTAGYPDVYSSPEVAPLFDDYDPNRVWTFEMLRAGLRTPVAPGERWEYSNTGYIILAQLLDEVTHGPLEARVEQFLATAGIRESGGRSIVTMRRTERAAKRFAYGYSGSGTDFSRFTSSFEGADLIPTDMYGLPFGDGAFSGTALGAARFLDALFVRGTLLDARTVEEMIGPVPQSSDYGLGTTQVDAAGVTWQGHTGTYGGFTTAGFVHRDTGVTILVTVNKDTRMGPHAATEIWTELAETWRR